MNLIYYYLYFNFKAAKLLQIFERRKKFALYLQEAASKS